jgi:hypothetical protein
MKFKDILKLGTTYHYPTWLRYIEGISVIAFVILAYHQTKVSVESVSMLYGQGYSSALIAVVLGLILLAMYVLADFVSGVVHCAADNFGSPSTPFFGIALISPFREHHRDPDGITKHDFLETNGNSCLVCLAPLAIWLAVSLPGWPLVDLGLRFAVLTFCLFILTTNQFHKWSHTIAPPAFVRWLQKHSIILNPLVHKVHHTQPFDRYYCITNGWLNPMLDRLKFFEALVHYGHIVGGKTQPKETASLKIK